MAAQEPVLPLVRPRKKLILDLDEEVLPVIPTLEETLDKEIAALIAERHALSAAFRPIAKAYGKTRRELTALRLKLGEKFFAMKQELARKGRDGRWADYLRKWNNFPRTTADRYIANYQMHQNLAELIQTSTPEELIAQANRTTGAFSGDIVGAADTRNIAKSTLKRVTLNYTERDHESFTSALEILAKKFESKSTSKTVLAALLLCVKAGQK